MNSTPLHKNDFITNHDAFRKDASIAVYAAGIFSTSKNLFMKTTSLLRMLICVVCMFLAFAGTTKAQVSGYGYAATTGTYTALTAGGSITSTTTFTGGADDGYIQLALPFPFTYNGLEYTSVTAGTNGWVAMGNTTSTSNALGDLFANSGPANVVAAWWGNLNANTGNSGTLKYGTTAFNVFTMQFDQFSGASTGAASGTIKIRFQISLYGPNSSNPGAIEILYGSTNGTVTTGRSGGIKSTTGTTVSYKNSVNGLSNSTTTFSAFPANGTLYRYTPPAVAYKSQFISSSVGSASWCEGEVRDVTVTVKNIGTTAWTASGPVMNIGAQWSNEPASDYPFRVSVGVSGLAAGATATYTIPITGPATPGAATLLFDVVKEGACWFRDNIAGCAGPGNDEYVSAALTVTATAKLALSSAAGTDNQTKCVNTALTSITYLGSGSTSGASVTAGALPAGLTGVYNSGTKVFTISGTPTAAGIFPYTITASGAGTCTNQSVSGTITVTGASTISRSSAAGTDAQTLCVNNAITNITYAAGGTATGASITAGALPAGVTGLFSAGVFTISGTATAPGTFSYTVTTTGPCANPSLSGTITVNANSTLVLSSAAGTTSQTICQNTALTAITYAGGGGITGASITAGALPAGVTGTYNAGTKIFTISGTPTAFGSFSYTVTTTGPCNNVSLSGTINVTQTSTLTLVTAGTNTQTICTGSSIANIGYTYGGTATGASITAGALPAGVTGTDDGLGNFVIAGTPTVTGTFNYTVSSAGPCPVSLTGTITINANSTLTFTSAAGTDAQTKCINTAITNITYAIGGGGTGASITAGTLPAGVTGTYNSGTKVFTISGTATASGTFNYTVGTAGPCVNASLSGTITITPNATITLTSVAGTNAQTKCINNAITDITYAVGGSGTGASITAGALPAGVTGSFSAGVFTITGTPTASGSFSYTITTTGPCVNPTATGTITVNANSTLTFTSAVGTDAQTKCINNAITNITYLVGGGGTGASITAGALPAGVTGTYNSGTKVFTISGTPTASGTFSYTVGTAGPCINTTLSGTMTVIANATITLTSAAATTSQTVCQNSGIANITYTVGGTGTGASATGLPAGITGSYSAGVFTISGTPTTAVSGTFNYTVTTIGPCLTPNATGSITVNVIPTTTGVSICQNGTGSLTSAFTCADGSPVSTAARNAGTGASATGIGTIAWTNPGNITTAGTPYATAALTSSATSNYLVGTNFGFTTATVPANATIKGIQVTINRNGTQFIGTGITDNSVYLVKAGAVQSSATNKASGTTWSTSFSTASYGATTDLWGVALTAADVISTGFGVAIAAHNNIGFTSETATVDYMQVTITYTVPGSLNWYTVSSGGSSIGSGSSFNPVGVLNSGLATTANAGTTTFYAECSTVAGCRTPTDFVINALPIVSITGSNPICLSGSTTLSPTSGGTWASNSANATVTNAGVVNPVSAGSATFTFTESVHSCSSTTAAVTINANSTISLSSAVGTDAQTKCINTAITNITYTIGGGGTGASITAGALPAGLTGTYSAGVFTISGTPTASGSFSYTITTAGPCVNNSLSGTITVNANSTITMSSSAGTDAQTVCINNAITDITYTTGGGGTGASITAGALPAGLTGAYNAGVFTISGTPTASGSFSYTVTTAGPCTNALLSGTITVNANSTISLSSVAGTDAQTVCINTPVINTTYAIGGGGTNASITAGALPAGVNGSYSAGVFTISGTPAVNGTFNYTVTTTGPCVDNSLSGSITVTANATISLTSGAGTDVQAVCNNSAITNITYLAGSGATGASVTAGALPAGVTGSFGGGVFTISGTPAAAGTFSYTITTTGGSCGQATASGSITVYSIATLTMTKTNVSQCINNNGSITITPAGGTAPYNYTWSGVTGSGNPATTPYPNPGNVSSVNGLTIGYYNVSVSDANGCQSAAITNIHVEYAYLVYITNSGSNSSACANTGSIALYGNAGVKPYSYSLDGINYQLSNTFTGLAAGPYTAYVKDASGCASTKAITVAAAPPIVVSPSAVAASSCSNDGSIQIFRTGGFTPYTYSITSASGPWVTGNLFTGLSAGSYTAYVKDAAGCVGQQAVNVTSGAALSLTVSKVNSSTCVNDGSIQVNINGGIAPFTYSKSGPGGPFQPGNSFTGLGQGNYAIVVKDAKGCSGNINVTINLNTISVTSYVVAASDCVSANGSIQLFRTGGAGPYTYSIDGNTYQPGTVFTGLLPGVYDGYVKDSKTCVGVQVGIVVGPESCVGARTAASSKSNLPAADKTTAVKISAKSVLKISAYPNPSAETFTLSMEGGNKGKVAVIVTDLLGRKVYQAETDVLNQYHFGKDFKAGVYMLQVIQGNDKQTIKLVKE